MRLLTRYILRQHILPFFLSLAIIFFLLFTNFLLRAIDRFLGKGLSPSVMAEYLVLNTAWIFALAAPMAVLVATLMAFGRLAEDRELSALRASGISFWRLLVPSFAFALLVAVPLLHFNRSVLPEMNHRARLLGRDIQRKRPDLAIEPGYFIDDLPLYSVIVRGRSGDRFNGIRIYSKERRDTQVTIHAAEGTFLPESDAIFITLFDGEIHELDLRDPEHYRRIIFEKHRIRIPADNLTLERRDAGTRSDREMTPAMMREKMAEHRRKMEAVREGIRSQLGKVAAGVAAPPTIEDAERLLVSAAAAESNSSLRPEEWNRLRRTVRSTVSRLKTDYQILNGHNRSVSRLEVELQKKLALPSACIVFVLIGAPLGAMARRGGFVTSVTLSVGFFIVYWVLLIIGEQFADRAMLSPILAMWAPNALLTLCGLLLISRLRRVGTTLRLPRLPKRLRGGG